MKTSHHGPDVIDTRTVLRVYAGLVGLAGVLLVAGLQGLTTTLVSDPGARRAFLLLSGAALLAIACQAIGLAEIEDPQSRRRGLLWFAIAHLVIFVPAFGIAIADGGPVNADVGLAGLLAATMLLFYFWWTGDGHRAGEWLGSWGTSPSLLSGRGPSAERLRSAYEERIREAAGQEERHRLARELHDSIKQQIFAMQTAAATAQTRFDGDPGGAKDALERVRESGREAMAEMEAMLDSLRSEPLTNAGLVEAMKKQAEALQFRSGARVEVTVGSLPPTEALAPGAQQAIFRVAQEALANVGRHARASRVTVSLGCDGNHVTLRVEDDGAGFDQSSPAAGMGLANMRERAAAFDGTLAVQSRPGGGTLVTLDVPYALWAQGDVAQYRRRVFLWAAMTLAWVLIVARTHSDWIGGLALVIINAVVCLRAAVAWHRARRRAEASQWIESPSHS